MDGIEKPSAAVIKLDTLRLAGVNANTWISFEPVLDDRRVLTYIRLAKDCYVNKVKIGKLNYYPSSIDWGEFGREAEELCQFIGLDYYIKDSLRKEMER